MPPTQQREEKKTSAARQRKGDNMRITIYDKNGNKIGSLNKCEISKQREHELKRIGAAYASEPVFSNYCDNQVVINGVNCYKTLEKMNKSYAGRR